MDSHAGAERTGQRYHLLRQIGLGGMGTVYRAYDRLAGQFVALKRLTPPGDPHGHFHFTDDGSQDIRLIIAREFSVLASLRHPNIISVLDYGFDRSGQPYFTMELLEGARTLLAAARSQPEQAKVELLVQLLRALAYLHRRGVIHRDLKPDNVLVIGDQVKVLDFGLALSRDRSWDNVSSISGTIPYMAPEVLKGLPADERSDLYAVGVMAYELFAGHHPFASDGLDIVEYAHAIQTRVPDFGSVNISESLAHVIARILAKHPENRFPTARAVITALSRATGMSVLVETSAVRESFIQAARFVGRENELTVLQGALAETALGLGNAWLIGGESGVGKSRLLSEVRTHALVQGLIVMQGQVEETRGGYQPWREILRWLALLVEPNDLEASILRTIVPDLGRLLGKEVADAPEIAPQHAQQRLFDTVTAMIQRLSRPLLIVMEDLQWASSEALALFLDMARAIVERPIVLLGSYRSDEEPKLPTSLEGIQLIRLGRFSQKDIEQLSSSMLGEAGGDAAVVELLQRETEGNAFFMVEVVRALAEEAGQLESVGQVGLPDHVFTGGIQRILRRRIERVAPEDRALLRLVAVAGHQVDRAILPALAPQQHISSWLTDCADVAVLEIQDGRWHFTHDRLREAVLDSVSTGERAALHRQVALAIETTYEDLTDQAGALAYHWSKADNRENECRYSIIAGRQAAQRFSNEEAITYFRRALELTEMSRITIMHELSRVLTAMGDWPAASDVLRQALNLTPDSVEEQCSQGYCLRLLGYFLITHQGQYEEGYAHLANAQDIFLKLKETPGLLLVNSTLGHAKLSQGDYAASLGYFEKQRALASEIGDRRGISDAIRNIGHVHAQQNDLEPARACFEESLKISTTLNDLRNIAANHSSLGVLYSNSGDITHALDHYLLQIDAFKQIGDSSGYANSIIAIGSLFRLLGDHPKALSYCAHGLEICVRLGDQLGTSIGLIYMAESYLDVGRYEDGQTCAALAIALVRRLQRAYHLAGYLTTSAELSLAQQDYDAAQQNVAEILELASRLGSRSIQFTARLLDIQSRFGAGEITRAAAVEQLLEMSGSWSDREQEANLHYVLWQTDKKQAAARQAAADLYRELYNNSPRDEFNRRYHELMNAPLPQQPQFPQLLNIIPTKPVDLPTLLKSTERWTNRFG
ncbi:MAG: tetratricopeptide repeat protein [Anaerolineae bacterium]|nr:tetratricopeptide repeat protein [Anaerolineae bacterium]